MKKHWLLLFLSCFLTVYAQEDESCALPVDPTMQVFRNIRMQTVLYWQIVFM